MKALIPSLSLALALPILTFAAPESEVIVDGLSNPSSVSFGPDGELTVCDSRGTVYVSDLEGNKKPYITGFDTEYWKSDDTGKKWYQVGPLSAVWIGETLAVTDSGKADGEEALLFFTGAGKASDGVASDGVATNTVGPTTKDEADKGEGNLTGLSVTADGKTIYVAGQGFDGKSWLLSADVETKKLVPSMSADENGIETNSPMDTLVTEEGNVIAVYSGKGGTVDGTVVEWDPATGQPVNQWKLPELVNPMGIASLGGDRYVVVENNWSLDKVNKGRVAVVTLTAGKEATVEPTGIELDGPVSCTVGPDGRVYVTQIGPEFDQPTGSVVAISGIE